MTLSVAMIVPVLAASPEAAKAGPPAGVHPRPGGAPANRAGQPP
jgi:hypothetical protein